MKKKYIILVLIISVIADVFTQGVQELTKTVVAVGVGATQNDAEISAVRSAVMMTVGEFIDAETLVKNGKLVDDKILSYSSGYVESYKQMGSVRALEGGLMEIKILAVVRRTVLQEKVKATIKSAMEVDGKSLFAEVLTRTDQLSDAKEMIESVFKDFPLKVLDATLESKQNDSPAFHFDAATGELFVPVRLRVNKKKYARMVKEIVDKIEPLAKYKKHICLGPRQKSAFVVSHNFANEYPYDFHIQNEYYKIENATCNNLFVIGDLNRRTGRYYYFEDNIATELHKWFGVHGISSGNLHVFSIKVNLLDKNEQVISQGLLRLYSGNKYDNGGEKIILHGYNKGLIVVPLVRACSGFVKQYGKLEYSVWVNKPNKISAIKHGNREMDGRDEIYTVSLGKIDPDILEKAVRMECRLELEYEKQSL